MIENRAFLEGSFRVADKQTNAAFQSNTFHAAYNHAFLGTSTVVKNLFYRIKTMGFGNSPILICGESGTGKKLIGRAIHRRNHRKSHQFVIIEGKEFPCPGGGHRHEYGHPGAAVEIYNRMYEADGGTILIAEIGAMCLEAQDRLLDYLQDTSLREPRSPRRQPGGARIIATTTMELMALVRKGAFRKELYRHLMQYRITIPPLRERPEDIVLLARHYLHKVAMVSRKNVFQISPSALHVLQEYTWPGNVRELENVVERAVILCHGSSIETGDLFFILPPNKKNPSITHEHPILYGRARVRYL